MCKIKEVFEVMSSLDFINDKDSIEDIAFVFQADILEHVLVNCARMGNVFSLASNMIMAINLLQ